MEATRQWESMYELLKEKTVNQESLSSKAIIQK